MQIKANRWQHLYMALLDKVKFKGAIIVSRNPSLLGPEISLRYLIKWMKIDNTSFFIVHPVKETELQSFGQGFGQNIHKDF